MRKRVGLVGVGLMGEPMARNWLKKGFVLTVLPHKNRSRIDDLVRLGALAATDHEDLAKKSDIIVFMLPTSTEVQSNIQALEPFLTSSHTIIDMGTSDPLKTRELHKGLKRKNLRFMDSPVTGGVIGAQNGTLTLFLGGPEDWIAEVKEVLSAVSQTRSHFGEAGNGHVAKLINNFICVGNLAVFSEALPLAVRAGLDAKTIFDTLLGGTAQSWMLNFYGPQILAGDFAPRYKMGHAVKDLMLAVGLAESVSANLPVLKALVSDFTHAEKEKLTEENISALIKVFEKQLGVKFRT